MRGWVFRPRLTALSSQVWGFRPRFTAESRAGEFIRPRSLIFFVVPLAFCFMGVIFNNGTIGFFCAIRKNFEYDFVISQGKGEDHGL